MSRMVMGPDGKSSQRWMLAITVGWWIGLSPHAVGQSADCALIADERNPSEKILRCGDHLTIRSAPNTKYQVNYPNGQSPDGCRLESGAIVIEFTASDRQKSFQILTPHAIAAVRGTKWAIEVASKRTSTVVLSGVVEVSHPDGEGAVLLLDCCVNRAPGVLCALPLQPDNVSAYRGSGASAWRRRC